MEISIPIILIILVVAWVSLREKKARCPDCGDRMVRQVRPMAVAGSAQYWECGSGHIIDIPDKA